MSKKNNNPYAQAAGTYDTNAKNNAGSQRELEARILMKANRMIEDLLQNWENQPKGLLEDTLKYNRQIWMLFYDTALENKEGDRPNTLRSNIVNLANFIFKREMEILADPEKNKFDILLNINKEVSAGLMTQVETEKQQAAQSERPQHNNETYKATDISG